MRNTWISSARLTRIQSVALEPEELAALASTSSDPVVDQVVEEGTLFAALRNLSVPLREAVVAVDVAGLSYREAAQALGCKEGTIMSRLYRGRGELAAVLQAGA
jgi:RNA polymerase sigma-70 factor (ECF subfamily)